MEHNQMRTWAEISLPNLEHNYRALRQTLPEGCRFLGVVKANAYGHGAVPVARRLEALGADYLAVATLDEAVELRENGVCAPILILGYVPPQYAGELLEYGITQTVGEEETARALSQAAVRAGNGALKIHVKLDTGMSRLGFLCSEARQAQSVEAIARVCALPGLEAEGIFTHFANADADADYTALQLRRFRDTVDKLSAKSCRFKIRHCAASAAVLNYPHTHLDMVRPGIALYGHDPDPGCKRPGAPELRPVMTLKTRVAALRELSTGTAVGYGCTHTLARDSQVAVLPIGYADGLSRLLSNRGELLVRGRRVPILGRVCMDLCMADVTGVPNVQVGDEVVVFGPELPLEEKTEQAGTIQHELLCAVSRRVPRVVLD